MTKLVVAIGGNALQPAGEAADAAAQRRRVEATAGRLTDLVAEGHDVVVTHGNGPQVGNILLQNEETRHLVPPMPLDVCGAESQALIGYLLEQALRNEFALRKIDRDIACVVTQVLVHADHPAFANPTKPIGPYYLRADEILEKKAIGWKHLVIATDVPQIALDFGKSNQRFLDRMTIAEAKKHLAEGQFPPGSMGPKVEAVVEFLEHGGQHAVITDLEHLAPAVAGKAGTQVGRA